MTESRGESDGEEARGEIIETEFEIRIRRDSLSYRCEYICLIGKTRRHWEKI